MNKQHDERKSAVKSAPAAHSQLERDLTKITRPSPEEEERYSLLAMMDQMASQERRMVVITTLPACNSTV